ncbi:hypothetical protein EJB05_57193, partial [Eragrostis curvula]
MDTMYPVESDGMLFICFRHEEVPNHNSNLETYYCTYRANLDKGEMIPSKVLDGRSLFVGQYHTRSVSVPAGISPSIKPDDIYVCNDNYMNSGRPRIDAFDALGESVEETNFDEDDIAYYLSFYFPALLYDPKLCSHHPKILCPRRADAGTQPPTRRPKLGERTINDGIIVQCSATMQTSACEHKCTRQDEDTARDRANLPEEPAGSIAERLLSDDVADYVRFRAACVAWRACSVEPRAHSVLDRRFQPRRWIMLPSTLNAAGNRRLFLNVSTGERIRVRLPDPHLCNVLRQTAEGLVLLCQKDTYLIQLLNPLTGQLADLPSAATLLEEPLAGQLSNHHSPSSKWSLDYELEEFVLRDAGFADDSTIALLFGYSNVAFAKPDHKGSFQDK